MAGNFLSALNQATVSNSQSFNTTGTPAPSNQTPNKDEFLKLFLAQLQQQDPLSPSDSAQFTAQLAQFASVEQMTQTNQQLADLQAAQAANSRSSLANLVGRGVEARADSFTLQPTGDREAPPLAVDLGASASSVKVTITDAAGKVVKTFDLGAQQAGVVKLNWDGKGANGADLPPGDYNVKVEATNTAGQAMSAFPILDGLIEAIEFNNGSTLFRMGDALVSPASIMSVQM